MGGAPPDRLGILPIVLDGIDNGYALEAGWADLGMSFVGGTRLLVDAVARGLEVRLRSVATRIEHGPDGVTISLADGSLVRAAAAVVALPLNVWRDVAFDPPLARRQGRGAGARAPRALVQGARGRAQRPGRVRGLGLGDAAPGAGVDGRRRGRTAARRVLGRRPGRWHGPAGGDRRRAGVHPGAEIVANGGHDWVADPFSRGAWFAEPPAWPTITGGEDLEAPVGRLAFAGGDLPRIGAGWIEGAVASGGRAAARVAALLAY